MNNNVQFLFTLVFATMMLTSCSVLIHNVYADSVTTTVPVSGSPEIIGVNTNTNMIYVTTASNGGKINVIDGSTNSVVSTIPVNGSQDVAVNPVTNRIYIAGGFNDTVYVINGSTNSIVSTISGFSNPEGIGVNPNTNMIYASNLARSTVSVIDGSTNSVVSTIPVRFEPLGVGVNPATNRIYVANYHNDTVSVIDGTTNSVVDTIQVGSNPQKIGINPITNKIYVTTATEETDVIDGTTDSVTKIPIPSIELGVNPNTNRIYWSNGNQNSYVDIINGTTNNLIATLTGFDAALGVGVNPATNRIYVANYHNDTVSVIDGTTTAPQPPTGLTANTVSSSQINLSWTASSSNGGATITGYEVERSKGDLSFGSFSNSTSNTFFSVPNATTFADTGLDASTTYNYTVFAKNSAGASPPSNTASATTSATAPPPTGIILNNIKSISGTVSSSPYQLTLANFNAGTGSNNLLVVGISANNNNVISITFGGASLTKKVSSFSNNDAEFWYLKNPSGTGNIVVNMGGATSVEVGAYSFSGVNQTAPIPTSVTKHNTIASSPKISITTQYPNSWILDVPSIYGGVTLGSPTCTQQWDADIAGAITGASSSSMIQSPGSATCSWTASGGGDLWDDAAIEIKASDTGSGSTTTVPSSPTGLTATAGNSQDSLSWTAPSSNGGSAISGYNIYRGTTSGGEGTTSIGTVSGSMLTYTDTGLTNGQTYFYKVTAVNSIGQSTPSNEASATPAAAVTAPQPPTGLAANAISSSQINLSWTAPANNGGSAITGYMIERSNNTGTTWSTVQSNTGSTATTYDDTGLAASTSYTYRVSAINSAGTSSPSNTASATTSVTAPPPTGITLDNIQKTSGTTSSSNQITLANFNAGSGNNNLLVVGISANNAAVTSVTFGGTQLTQKISSFNNNDAEFWYLQNPTGTGNIVVTMGGSTSVVVGAYSFSGVDQTTPIPTTATNHNTAAGSPKISITTQYPNSWVLDVPAIYGGVTLGSPTCTQQWDTNIAGAITGASSSAVKTSAGSTTCSWTASGGGDLWDDAAIEIKASG